VQWDRLNADLVKHISTTLPTVTLVPQTTSVHWQDYMVSQHRMPQTQHTMPSNLTN